MIDGMCGCSCANGEPVPHSECTLSTRMHCSWCNAGYHLYASRCVKNECICINGEGAAGLDCVTHRATSCSSCNSGYHLDRSICVINTCTCSNGKPPSPGPACSDHGTDVCLSCNSGYQLGAGQCIPDLCTCTNGQPAAGSACPKAGSARCISCSSGYHLIWNRAPYAQCEVNVCTCRNGQPSISCGIDGIGCHACSSGYSLPRCTPSCGVVNKDPWGDPCEADSCTGIFFSNLCQCQRGQYMIPDQTQCKPIGSPECDPGSHRRNFDDPSCHRNICRCKHGEAASGPACSSHYAEICAACHAGFQLYDGCCCDDSAPCKCKSIPDFITGGRIVTEPQAGVAPAGVESWQVNRMWFSPHPDWKWLSYDDVLHCLEERPLMLLGDSTVRMMLHDIGSMLYMKSTRHMISTVDLNAFGIIQPPEMVSVERYVKFEGVGHATGSPCKYKDQREVFTGVGAVAVFHFVPSWCCLDEAFLSDVASSLHKDPAMLFYGGSTYWDITRMEVTKCWKAGESWGSYTEHAAASAMSAIRNFAHSLNEPPLVVVRNGPGVYAGSVQVSYEQTLVEKPAILRVMPEAVWHDYQPQMREFGSEWKDHPDHEVQRSVTMTVLNMLCRPSR
eukprot:gnl/TRDRNA2_/TRDRNA2_194902_c0_seq1.p1 gnl/TRDRNA2_/TRDRNA2_194902_c0~~gnl/TRDRNA2_/TRDRNA2_194902_c0_seq1.p1  ORF type:complete len:679 (-),score=40.57 gnl/TRDRNA2_/TRDRNA2_194902_c0_seq1:18-1868(-)